MSNALWDAYVSRARAKHGEKLDLSEIEAVAPEILAYFGGARIELERVHPDGETWRRRGRVGVSTGWRPALLLLSRVDSSGSSDLINRCDRLVKVV